MLAVAGMIAANGWQKIVNNCKGCINCHGFGISRCNLSKCLQRSPTQDDFNGREQAFLTL